jgi:hypothetical protein
MILLRKFTTQFSFSRRQLAMIYLQLDFRQPDLQQIPSIQPCNRWSRSVWSAAGSPPLLRAGTVGGLCGFVRPNAPLKRAQSRRFAKLAAAAGK